MNDIQRTIRAALDGKGISVGDLAAAVGLSVVSINDQIQGQAVSHRRIRKIEKFLNTPIWTPTAQFMSLNRASEILGSDAVLTGFQELRRQAIAIHVPNARKFTSKDDLVRAVLAHYDTQHLTATPNEKVPR